MALRISDLGTAPTVEETDLVEIAEVDGESPSGYSSYKTTILGIANKIATSTVFSGLVTTAKNIVGAINEIVNGFDDNVIDVIKDLKQVRSATITDGIATFDDVLEANPLVEATATFSPKQSGTGDPSPTNIRPISGRAELNLYQCGKNQSPQNDATTTANGALNLSSTGTFGSVKSGYKYTFSFIPLASNTGGLQLRLNNVSGGIKGWSANTLVANTRETFTFTASADGDLNFYCQNDCFANSTKVLKEIQLEYGETATAYEPYQGETHTVTFPDTIMGGNYNFVSGDGTTNLSDKVDLGSLTWAYDSNGQRFYSSALSDMKSTQGWNNLIFYPENYKNGEPKSDGTGGDNIIGLGNNRIYIRNTQYTDATSFKTAMSGYYVCYELATPTPISLTGQEIEALEGVNVVTTDGDRMISVKYKKMNL